MNWRVGSGSAPLTQPSASSLTLPIFPAGTTNADVLVGDPNGQRRLHIEVVPQGPLAVGHQTNATASSPGVVSVVGTGDATPTSVTDTFLARPYHTSTQRTGSPASSR